MTIHMKKNTSYETLLNAERARQRLSEKLSILEGLSYRHKSGGELRKFVNEARGYCRQAKANLKAELEKTMEYL